MHEMRCETKLHGILVDGVIEIKCSSKFCGAAAGVVVLHRFDPMTGDLISTNKYRTPERSSNRATYEHAAPVRPA